MVYNSDLSRAFDTEVSAYRSCSSSWAAVGLSSLLGAYQRKPGPAAAPSLAESRHSALSTAAAPTPYAATKQEESDLADSLPAPMTLSQQMR